MLRCKVSDDGVSGNTEKQQISVGRLRGNQNHDHFGVFENFVANSDTWHRG